jgi:hypothetical protein
MLKKVLGFIFILIAAFLALVEIVRLPKIWNEILYFLEFNYTAFKLGGLIGFLFVNFILLFIIYNLFKLGFKWIKK